MFGLRRSSRIFVALKARERIRLSAMLIDGSQATIGRVDVNQIREIGSNDMLLVNMKTQLVMVL